MWLALGYLAFGLMASILFVVAMLNLRDGETVTFEDES